MKQECLVDALKRNDRDGVGPDEADDRAQLWKLKRSMAADQELGDAR